MTTEDERTELQARLMWTGFGAIATVAWLVSFLVGFIVTQVYGTDYRQGMRFTLLINAALLAFLSGPIARRVPVAGRALLERRDRLDATATAEDLRAAEPTSLRTFAVVSFPLAFLAVIV